MLHKVRHHVGVFNRSIRTVGSFTQNLTITFSGNIVALVIGFAFTPFIARIYGPEAYGVFALFLAVASNLAPLATFQYPSGYVAAGTDNEFYRIVKITLLVLLTTTLIYVLVIFFWGNDLIETFHVTELTPYIFWMPIYFFLMGLDYILLGWNIRLKEFKRGAIGKTFSTIFSKGSTVAIGLMVAPSTLGIIIGNLVSYPVESIAKLSPVVRSKVKHIFDSTTWTELKATFLKFKSYPLYLTPGLFVTNLSSQLPVYYFSMTFSQATVGFFALANSMVNIPLSLLVSSSTTVFLQKAAETIQQPGSDLKNLVRTLHKRLFFISYFPICLLAFTSEWIFKVVFGLAWAQSGIFASFLCIGVVFNVSFGPLSVLFRLLHKEKINFTINILSMGLKYFGLWIGFYFDNILWSVMGYSIASSVSYLFSLVVIFHLVKLSPWMLVRHAMLMAILIVGIILFNN
jgi:O-antigen/teichoic acid export membrane protein